MKEMIKRLLAALLLFVIAMPKVNAQALPDSTIIKIDRLFEKWNKPDAPGCVAGVIIGDQLVYAKGFGLANLESKAPNTPESIYYMCSVSKQFAGYSIALLARQGKLQLDDDIQQYLPWADFRQKITVRHLLNHTSGIRDDISLAAISGLGGNGMLTQTLALNILKRQRTLNFNPGEKYFYSNSNYVLLAEIVAQVSKQSFRSFTDSAIFIPLGMSASRFISDPDELVKGRAASYTLNNGQFSNSYQNVYTLGDGGLFTSLNDMAKWVSNFYTPVAGDAATLALMTEQGKLNNGETISYAMGIAVDSNRGHKRLLHNGGLAGYRTIMLVYPALKMGFLVFGNTGEGDIYNKGNQLENLLVPDRSMPVTTTAASAPAAAPAATTLTDTVAVKKWLGNYISATGYKVTISLKAGTLFVNESLAMAPESATVFHLTNRPAIKYTFYGDSVSLASPALTKPMLLEHVPDKSLTEAALDQYTGTYYSPEMDCNFRIVRKGRKLWITSNQYKDGRITLAGTEHLLTDYDFMSHLLIKRDSKGRIIGFDLNSGGIMHLFFRKTQ
jgi:CubicO group peptidase (beta-lactamase class C family)